MIGPTRSDVRLKHVRNINLIIFEYNLNVSWTFFIEHYTVSCVSIKCGLTIWLNSVFYSNQNMHDKTVYFDYGICFFLQDNVVKYIGNRSVSLK